MAKGSNKQIETDTRQAEIKQAEVAPIEAKDAPATKPATKEVQDVVPADQPAPAQPPPKPQDLDEQSLAQGIPEMAEPQPGDDSLSADTNMGIADPTVERDSDPFNLGLDTENVLNSDIEEFLEATPGFGGADGRNPASDSGGLTSPPPTSDDDAENRMPTEFTIDEGADPIGNPYSGDGFIDGSAAGKLPPHQQGVLDSLKDELDKAAAAGDHDGVTEIADKAHEFLVEIGASEPPAENTGSVTAPVTFTEDEGVKDLPAGKAIQEKYEGTWREKASNFLSGTSTNTTKGKALDDVMKDLDELGDGSTGTEAPAEDREEEFDAPDLHKGFTDEYFDLKFGAEQGGDIDPNPNDDPLSASLEYDPGDPDQFVAQYAQGDTEPTEEELERAMQDRAPSIEEEFFET